MMSSTNLAGILQVYPSPMILKTSGLAIHYSAQLIPLVVGVDMSNMSICWLNFQHVPYLGSDTALTKLRLDQCSSYDRHRWVGASVSVRLFILYQHEVEINVRGSGELTLFGSQRKKI